MSRSVFCCWLLLLLSALSFGLPSHAASNLSVTKREYVCLAKNIYYEARGEPLIGRIAVAFVVLNRAQVSSTRLNLCDVVYKRCQFSWTCARKYAIVEEDAWVDAQKVAGAVLQKGNKIKDPTHGARFYHRIELNPRWTRDFKFAIRYGDHLFYPKGAE
jgi:N-acetylmuramoyl-L-alanine amidase